jgi:hypothetical protein
MAFTPYPQGHRLCILDEAKRFVFYISPGRGLLHPRCPDSLYDFRPAVRLPYQWIRTCDFFGKSRYEGRDLPFFSPAPLLLCSFAPEIAIRHLSATVYPPVAGRIYVPQASFGNLW